MGSGLEVFEFLEESGVRLAAGGEVIGVIPQQLVDWEVAHRGVTRLEVVDSMHTRKARMAAQPGVMA